MRLMATVERQVKNLSSIQDVNEDQQSEKSLTHIVNSPWNDDICILLSLEEKYIFIVSL